jgi:kinetochore protein Spc7/SPC105
MEKRKTAYIQAEEAAAVTPELFVEYSQADEEGQADMLVSIEVGCVVMCSKLALIPSTN